jgi:hypothetical protein
MSALDHEHSLIGGVTGVVLSESLLFIWPLRWFALLGLILVFVDMRFDHEAKRARGEAVDKAHAWRRTGNKIVDYFCWIMVAAAIDRAFISLGVPMLPSLALLVVYGCEIDSLYKNYFAARGKKVSFSFFSFFKSKGIEVKDNSDGTTTKEDSEKA